MFIPNSVRLNDTRVSKRIAFLWVVTRSSSPPAQLQEASDSVASPGPSEVLPVFAEDVSVCEWLLQGGSFPNSRVKKYWQLANAAYNPESSGHVSQDGKLWHVLVDHRPTNTRVIARELPGGVVEVAFRGTVSEDVTGLQHSGNWATNLDSKIVPLSRDLVQGSGEIGVHRGFQAAYEAVFAALLAWLRERLEVRSLCLAGHSLGGALATLAAIHLQSIWKCIDLVVTFGSPKAPASKG